MKNVQGQQCELPAVHADHRGGGGGGGGNGRGGSGERYSFIQKMRDRDRDVYKKDKYSGEFR